jgi:plastocyanin
MKVLNPAKLLSIRWMFVFLLLTLTPIARAQWKASLGAQSQSMGHQALAFLPNEIWIHTGDSVTWTSNVDEIHTVSFLTAGQVRLPFQVGCPGFTVTGFATFDGSTCITTPPLVKGQTFTVNFPTAGNYKLVCLVHQNMTGVVHVLDWSLPLPHAQSFYDLQAAAEGNALLSDDLHNHEAAVRRRSCCQRRRVPDSIRYALYESDKGYPCRGNRGMDELRPGHTAHHHVRC